MEIGNRERAESSAGFRFRLLQSTPGNGDVSGGPPYTVGVRFIKCSANWVPFDKHFTPMSLVVFRDDIDRTIPHISKAIEEQSAVEESKPAAVEEFKPAAVEKSKPAAKKAKYALSSTGSRPVLNDITNYF